MEQQVFLPAPALPLVALTDFWMSSNLMHQLMLWIPTSSGSGLIRTPITLDTNDLDGELVGVAITRNGIDTGETVTGIAAGELTASGDIDVANDDVLGFAYNGGLFNINTDHVLVDDATLATVGEEVTQSNVATGETVAGIHVASNTIRLTGPNRHSYWRFT